MGERNYAALPYEYLAEMEILTDEEFGRLCRGLIKYSMDGTLIDSSGPGNERFFAVRVMRREDGIQASYKETVEKNRANGQKGGRPKNPKKPTETQNNPNKPKETQTNPTEPTETQKTEVKVKVEVKDKDEVNNIPPESPPRGAKTQQPKVQWAEFVTMTNDEHDKLLATYGPADTQRLIEILDNYKGSSGHKYKSDYRAILSWVVDRLKEEKSRNQRQNTGNRGNSPPGNPFLEILADMERDELNIVEEEST